MAKAKLRQGKVTVHGLLSSPWPETKVRLTCAVAGVAPSAMTAAMAARTMPNRLICVSSDACCRVRMHAHDPACCRLFWRDQGHCPFAAGVAVDVIVAVAVHHAAVEC